MNSVVRKLPIVKRAVGTGVRAKHGLKGLVVEVDRLRTRSGYTHKLHTPKGFIPLRKIGSGSFSRIYRSPKYVYIVVVAKGCPDKDIMVQAHESFPRNPHLPNIHRFGTTKAGDLVYRTRWYRTPLRRDAGLEAWEAKATLNLCWNDVLALGEILGSRANELLVECTRVLKVEPALVEALDALREAAAAYSKHYIFEFPPRNLASDEEGHLVLLDVLYNEAELPWLDEVERAKFKKDRQ